MVMPTTAITRFDLSAPFSEFDLRMNRMNFIGPRVLRPRIVGVQAADIGKIPLEQLLQEHNTRRAPGGGYRRGEFEFTKYNYATEEYGWEEPLDDRTLKIFADHLDAESIKSQRAIDFVLGEYERDVSDAVMNTTTWTGAALTTAITNEWDDHTNGVPIDDIHSAVEKVGDGSGLRANALICNSFQFWHLLNTAQVIERVKYTATPTPNELTRAVAEMLELDFLLIAGGYTNTANAGAAASISRIWPNEYAMVARVAVTDDPQEACIGRTFIWSGDGPGAPGTGEELALIVEEYREEGVRGGVIRARNDRDIVIMYPEAGHLLSNVIT
jgi:hypothetical protein